MITYKIFDIFRYKVHIQSCVANKLYIFKVLSTFELHCILAFHLK